MKTNLSTKTITGISLMALFIVGCSGGDQNSTRPSFQSPSSSRSFPLSGGTSSTVTPAAPAESGVSGNEEPAAHQTAAAEDGNADIQEAIDAANAAAAAANKAASSSDGAQTAGIVAAALAGVGALLSVGGDYLVNKKSSERDDKISSGVSEVGQKVDRNLEVDLAGHAGTQVKVDGVASSQTGVIQRLDAREVADNNDAELAENRHQEGMSAIAETRRTLELAKTLLLEKVEKLATTEQVAALTEEIKKAASHEDLERVQTKLIEAFEFQTKKEDMVSAVMSRLSADPELTPNLIGLLPQIRDASNESELASIVQPHEEQLLHPAGIQVVVNPAGDLCFEECTPAEEPTDNFRTDP